MSCPFCDVRSGADQKRVLEYGERVIVLFSNPRLMKGHLLVIPKRHVEKLSELTKEERDELLDAVMRFQEKILSTIASGCDIRQNYRPFIKDGRLKRSHLHFHLQPRELEDELYDKCQRFEMDIFHELTEGELEREKRMFGQVEPID